MSFSEVLSRQLAYAIQQGHAATVLQHIPDQCVQTVVTSPPYYQLRDYKTGTWQGGTATCQHQRTAQNTCSLCHAVYWDQQIGLEDTSNRFLDSLRHVFREVLRVLRHDGCLWLNIGDCFAEKKGTTGKSLANIPHRLVEGMKADGWIYRQEVIWRKASPLPVPFPFTSWQRCRRKIAPCAQGGGRGRQRLLNAEQRHMSGMNGSWHAQWEDCPGCPRCQDHGGFVLRRTAWRPTTGHEQLFLLTRSPHYYADPTRILTPPAESSQQRARYPLGGAKAEDLAAMEQDGMGSRLRPQGLKPVVEGVNPRSVQTFSSGGTTIKHYATFPVSLVRWCLEATTPQHGVCAACGAPWARVVTREVVKRPRPNALTKRTGQEGTGNMCPNDVAGIQYHQHGWRATCSCTAAATIPAIVLDPFCGSGTTLAVARQLGLRALGCDLSAEYIAIANQRIQEACGMFHQIT